MEPSFIGSFIVTLLFSDSTNGDYKGWVYSLCGEWELLVSRHREIKQRTKQTMKKKKRMRRERQTVLGLFETEGSDSHMQENKEC